MLTAAVALMLMSASPASAKEATVGSGLETALTLCGQWILEPATWADDIAAFPQKSGLAEQIRSQEMIPDVAQPPPSLRQNNHYFHVPVGKGGYYVTVSEIMPMCHVAGGGPMDFQPEIEAQIVSPAFRSHWKAASEGVKDDMRSGQYVSMKSPKLTMTLSRASRPAQRTDRVQLLITAQYSIGN
jgi:hypothetical protein